jgi:hypothetical protein
MKNDMNVVKQNSLTQTPYFPTLWLTVLDQILPTFVKDRFSPKESWKTKPFSQTDVTFFSTGLLELSDFFTIDREGAKLPNYFTTAKFRSSYFLYFFALQGAKFLALFDRYPRAVDAALEHAVKTGVLRVIDVGSGPGTASIAFLVSVLERFRHAPGFVSGRPKTTAEKEAEKKKKSKIPFKIELVWIDHNGTILKDGELLLARITENFSSQFELEIDLVTEARSWWKHPRGYDFSASLILMGNVLNESPNDPRIFQEGLAPFFRNPQGAGVLMVEPAFRTASQRVAQIRDELMLDPDALADSLLPIWGPCLHQEKCPLADGRDWCHFSIPTKLPGAFFRKFSIKLGGVREWLKFSFVWIGSKNTEIQPEKGLQSNFRRVVSDPIKTRDGHTQNQLCEPVRVGWAPSLNYKVHRGDIIRYAVKNDPVLQSKKSSFRNGKGVRNGISRPRVQK